MKTKAIYDGNLSDGITTVKPELDGKFANDPVFVAKAEKMKKILEKAPIPEHLLRRNK